MFYFAFQVKELHHAQISQFTFEINSNNKLLHQQLLVQVLWYSIVYL
jgi:hypothetical protein